MCPFSPNTQFICFILLYSLFMYLVIVEMKGLEKNLQSKHFSLISIIFIVHEIFPQKY